MTVEREMQLQVGDRQVSAIELRPTNARLLYVFAHGAGAGMRHAFMARLAQTLAARDIATLRYQFPYAQAGNRRPDPRRTLLATVRAAVDLGRTVAPDLPLYAGGKSMGGRMTSLAASEARLEGVRGLVFVGFPLHPPDRPGIERAEHLARVQLPMLFLQGTRDKLSDLGLLAPIVDGLGAEATLHVVEGADHGFHVLKRSGRTDEEVFDELGNAIARWTTRSS